jgi:hypothetical protein
MAIVAWPDVLRPTSFGYYHLDSDVSGGRSVGGGEQFIASPGPRWGASMALPIHYDEQVLAVRALRSKLQGRANPVVLPNFDGRRVSWPVEAGTGRVLTPRTASQLVGTYGLEGTAYAGAEIPPAAEINATVQTSVALRAVQMVINVAQGGPIKEGQQFGFAARLHEISEIVSLAGTVATVKFWPPLRNAAPAGTILEFTRPKCLMRCVNMGEELGALEMLRWADLNLQFVEYL